MHYHIFFLKLKLAVYDCYLTDVRGGTPVARQTSSARFAAECRVRLSKLRVCILRVDSGWNAAQ